MARTVLNEEMAELLKSQDNKSIDPELMKLVLLLANKALDKTNPRYDEEGALLVRNINF